MRPDVLILGGGVIGLSAAHACAVRGARVTLVHDGAAGASAAAAGMLCPSFEAMQTGGRTLAALGQASLALWDDYAKTLADDPMDLGYERPGVIGVGYPPGALPGPDAPVPPGIEAGRAVLVAGEGQVDPRRLLPRLAAACRAANVRFVTCRAERLILDGELQAARGALMADGTRIEAGLTVAATGASGLVPGIGLERVRGRAFLVRNVLGLTRVIRSPGVYLAPKPGGTLYVGATEEEAGTSRAGQAATDGLWSEALWLAPALRDAEIAERFDGWRPRLPDELPLIGRHPAIGRLLLAMGHHRNGVLLAPLTARRIADEALGP